MTSRRAGTAGRPIITRLSAAVSRSESSLRVLTSADTASRAEEPRRPRADTAARRTPSSSSPMAPRRARRAGRLPLPMAPRASTARQRTEASDARRSLSSGSSRTAAMAMEEGVAGS